MVPVGEYLSSVYEPEMDFVDGELENRNVGEKDHSKLQARLIKLLPDGFAVFPEVRIQVSPTRFRVPDVCVYLAEPEEQVFTSAPFVVIEILSPEDRMSRMQRKIEDYWRMGCPNVWILDPWRRKAYRYDGNAMIEALEALTTDDSRLRLGLNAIFPEGR